MQYIYREKHVLAYIYKNKNHAHCCDTLETSISLQEKLSNKITSFLDIKKKYTDLFQGRKTRKVFASLMKKWEHAASKLKIPWDILVLHQNWNVSLLRQNTYFCSERKRIFKVGFPGYWHFL